jgi:phosphatidylserine/phosphatidylglycerophosphate/cardiolipin synthase-like enzyme
MSELAVNIKSRKGLLEVKDAILTSFANKRIVKGKDIISNFPTSERIASRAIIYLLLNRGVLKTVKSQEDIDYYVFSLNKNLLDEYIDNEIESLKVIKDIEPMISANIGKEIELLVTYPNDAKFSRVDGFNLLYPALKKMIMGAKKSLMIVNPFFDPFGTLQILDDLTNAAKRGVNIRIVTRDANSKGTPLEKSLRFIYSKFKENDLLHAIQIKDYYLRDNKTQQQIFAVHSKILVADKKVCYLGSANITSTCLYSNLETGIVLKGKSVSPVEALFNSLWKVARPIKRTDFINES